MQVEIDNASKDSFKKTIRILLDQTFIVRDKDENCYKFALARENIIRDYLEMIGFDIVVQTQFGVVMLKERDDDSGNGTGRMNRAKISGPEYRLLLILWKMYLEKSKYTNKVYLTKKELIDRLNAENYFDITATSSNDLEKSLKTFRSFNVLFFSNVEYEQKEESEKAEILLYPSIQFALDTASFQTYVKEHLQGIDNGEEKLDESEGEQENE